LNSDENRDLSEKGEALFSNVYRQELIDESHAVQTGQSGLLVVPRWFAVYTSPRHEKRVEHHFSQRDIENYLPLYQSQRKWNNGLRVNISLPIFPSYIFVRVTRKERVRVLEVPGVQAIVGGTGCEPAPISDTEIDSLRSGLQIRHAEPHPLLTVGQRVRIRSGALVGMEGVLLRRKTGLRVVLTVSFIMQSVAVEVDESELEPLDAQV
jgi:transcription antitermination factor NusG